MEKVTGGPLTLGRLLKAIRQGDEYSQVEFAKILGISKSHLCDIEKGRKVVSLERAIKFSKILKYSEKQFIRLCLQELIDELGLNYQIKVT